MNGLPDNIIYNIYKYDSTYINYFKKCVIELKHQFYYQNFTKKLIGIKSPITKCYLPKKNRVFNLT